MRVRLERLIGQGGAQSGPSGAQCGPSFVSVDSNSVFKDRVVFCMWYWGCKLFENLNAIVVVYP